MLYRLQNIAQQPVSYFESVISKEELAMMESKLKTSKKTWNTLTTDLFHGVLYEQEIGDAAASVQCKFYEKYPNKEDWFVKRIHEFLNRVIEKVKASCLSELKKQLSIADLKHSQKFLSQIKYHYEANDEEPEMQQEKLWMLATSSMSTKMN